VATAETRVLLRGITQNLISEQSVQSRYALALYQPATEASFGRAWSGASDDVMRSMRDLDRESNCAENSVSYTLHLITVWVTFLTQSFCMRPNLQGLTWFECREISK